MSISPVSIYGEVYGGKDSRKRCVLSLEWNRGVIDGDRGGDDSVDRIVQGSEKVKNQDVDEAHGKSEGVYSKGGVLYVEKNAL